MSTSDGVNKKLQNNKNRRSGETTEQVSPKNYKETSPEISFRGFQKLPRVVVTRYDISPYLKTLKKPLRKIKTYKSSSIPQEHAIRLSQKCAVKIVNEDLNKLLAAFPRKQVADNSDDSDSDTENMSSSNIKCKICEKGYSTEKKLLKHQQKKHMIVCKPQKRVSFSDHVIIHEVKEYHKCRKCTKIFEHYRLLKMHMKEHHKKRKCYICNYCNKKFVDRTIFKVHIRLHCSVCGELFTSKAKFIEHRRTICRMVKLHKCKTCDEMYYSIMHLKDHSYIHTDTKYYVCDICKDQFVTKCLIAHHISFLHQKKKRRPISLYTMINFSSERLYLCNFCEESSVEKDIIEKHVQTLPDLTNKAMTGYKDYYFCDHCSKKFDTETDMLQHKWTHFLKTSDNSQVRNIAKKKHIKTTYNVNEVIPEYLKPNVVLEKITIGGKVLTETVEYVDVKSFDINNGIIKKPIVNPKSKKTIISRHQCQTCEKYYSSNYCLNRHIETQHSDYSSLQCKVCEETFVWPSLLRSHKCIRLSHPEMPFEDARPEIHFDNLHELSQNGFDDLRIEDSDDYLNSVDFEIPAPICELKEYESSLDRNKLSPLQHLGYKLVMQEVPIEF